MPSTTTTPIKRPFRLSRLLQSKDPERRDPDEYQEFVKGHYDGPYGWFTVVMGYLNGHESLAGRLFEPGAFDLTGCKRILDAGCGNGRYLRIMLKQADADAQLVGFDLSQGMLRRARNRLKSDRPQLLAADLTRLPYRDAAFDALVCGWVLEHLPDPAIGLRELARVVKPGGKILLLTTEDSLLGAISSRFYHSRTYRRADLRRSANRTASPGTGNSGGRSSTNGFAGAASWLNCDGNRVTPNATAMCEVHATRKGKHGSRLTVLGLGQSFQGRLRPLGLMRVRAAFGQRFQQCPRLGTVDPLQDIDGAGDAAVFRKRQFFGDDT